MSHPLTQPQVSRSLVLALAVSTAGLALFVLGPTGDLPSTAVRDTSAFLESLGAPTWLRDPTLWAFTYNIALFVPLFCMGALLCEGLSLASWAGLGFLGSLAVEAVQAIFLAGRSPELQDLVANTVGALVGALLARLAWWVLSRVDPH